MSVTNFKSGFLSSYFLQPISIPPKHKITNFSRLYAISSNVESDWQLIGKDMTQASEKIIFSDKVDSYNRKNLIDTLSKNSRYKTKSK